jgi:hypothetical protein
MGMLGILDLNLTLALVQIIKSQAAIIVYGGFPRM